MGHDRVLDRRALNRALLARQLLLERSARSPADAVGHLVGLQAQAPLSPHLALFARLDGFHPDDLSHLLETRRVVRLALLRSTIHLVGAEDAVALRSLLQPVVARATLGNWRRELDGLDTEAVAEAGRRLTAEQPLTPAELGRRLADRWPDRDPAALAVAVRGFAAMAQVPPRGMWGRSGTTRLAPLETWLPHIDAPAASAESLVLRYLTAFGPATAADVRTWSGLTGIADVLARLRPDLRAWRDEQGRELLDVADGVLPDPRTPAPVRFLPDFDNVLLSHADRARIVGDAHPSATMSKNGIGSPTFLVDGFVAGVWRVDGGRVLARPFAPLAAKAAKAVAAEAERLEALYAGNAAR